MPSLSRRLERVRERRPVAGCVRAAVHRCRAAPGAKCRRWQYRRGRGQRGGQQQAALGLRRSAAESRAEPCVSTCSTA
eukprot:1710289-Alexandrium_andersonii.AAC.1